LILNTNSDHHCNQCRFKAAVGPGNSGILRYSRQLAILHDSGMHSILIFSSGQLFRPSVVSIRLCKRRYFFCIESLAQTRRRAQVNQKLQASLRFGKALSLQ